MSVVITDEEAKRFLELLCANEPDSSTRKRLAELTTAGEDDDAYRQAATNEWASDETEIDDGAAVSVNDEGAWVQAWVWVSDGEAGVTREGDGCPKGDPECLGNNGDCHDACERPEVSA